MSEKLWVFKYTPLILDDLIVTEEKKHLLRKIINDLPTTLIYGHPGTGKGCFMDILIKETECEYLKINASMENSIDEVRQKIQKFATSFSVEKKVVYLNECDRLSLSAQDAMRQLQEDTHKICSFFFICNNINKITDAIKSRCGYEVSLDDPPGKEIFKRCVNIIKQENIQLKNKNALLYVIKKCYPDIRKIIGVLQSNVQNGIIKDISFCTTYDLFSDIFKKMKQQNIEELRKTLKSSYIEYSELYKYLYEQVIDDPDLVNNPGEFIILIGEALYRDYFSAIKEVNFMNCFFQLIKKDVI